MLPTCYAEAAPPVPLRGTDAGRIPIPSHRPWEGFARAVRTLRLWASRRRERRAIADLAEAAEYSDHLLRDIGISRGEARGEAAKPFWRP